MCSLQGSLLWVHCYLTCPPPGSTSFINSVMKWSGEFFENVHSVSSFRKHIKLGQYNLASLSRQEEKKKSEPGLSSTLTISTLL